MTIQAFCICYCLDNLYISINLLLINALISIIYVLVNFYHKIIQGPFEIVQIKLKSELGVLVLLTCLIINFKSDDIWNSVILNYFFIQFFL